MSVTFEEMIEKDQQSAVVNAVTKTTYKSETYGVGCVGSDPEVFVTRKTAAGSEVLAPAWKYLPTAKATKDFYADGFAVEIKPAALGCNLSHIGYVKKLLEQALKKCQAQSTTPLKYNIKNYTKIAAKHLREAPEEAVQLGCSASYNVYDERLEMPTNGRELDYRTAGGHLHIGCGQKPADVVTMIVRNCDLVAGVGSVLLFRGHEDARRRELYGRAGEFRLPAHGVEYRVPSSAVLGSPTGFIIMMDLVKQAANWAINKCDLMTELKIDSDKVREIINKLDVTAAQEMYNAMPWVWHRAMGLAYKYVKSITHAAQERVAKIVDTVFTQGMGGITALKATGKAYNKAATDWDATGGMLPYVFGDVASAWKLGYDLYDLGHSTQWPVAIYQMAVNGKCTLAGE